MPRSTDLALGAGAVLAVGLGVFALRPATLPEGRDYGDLGVAASPSADATASSSASARPSASTSSSPAGDPAASSWVVGAADGVVVRAARRDCDAEGSVRVATIRADGEVTEVQVSGLRAVGGVAVEDARRAALVGVDGRCERVGFGTTDGGATWKRLGKLPAIWSLVPGTDGSVHAPSGHVDVPCEPQSVTGLDARVARLACTDGRLLGTVSGGEDWSILGNNDGVRAVGFVSPTTALALVDDPRCAGVSVEISTDGGTDFAPAYCVEGRGPWGLVSRPGVAVVAGDDVIARTTDSGETWDVTQVRP